MHLRSWSIRTKLVLMLLVVSIGSILIVGYLGLESGRLSLTDSIFNHLTSVRAVKASQIESYFRSVRQEIRTLAQSPSLVTAMKAFQTSFPELSRRNIPAAWDAQLDAYYEQEFLPRLSPNLDGAPDAAKYRPSEAAARYLQHHYIAANPNPVGKKELLNQAGDGSAYSDVHGRYHPLLRNVIERFGYYDLFFIDAESGRIVYSVFKEADFATSLWTGPYRESNLAAVAKAVLASGVNGQYAISDFEQYDPSYAAPAAFVASPVVEGTQVIGVLAAQLPIDEINQIMTGGENWEQDGLGKSGETYLVGSDYFMRSVSRFLLQDREMYLDTLRRIEVDKRMIDRIDRLDTSILQQAVRTSGVDEALASQSGTRVIDDYRGIPVLSSYAPLDIEGLDWVILSEIDFAEANEPIVAFQTRVLFWTVVIVAVVVILSILLSHVFVRPILALITASRTVGEGKWDVSVRLYAEDEIGELSMSFNRMVNNIREKTEVIEAKSRENQELFEFIRETFGRYVSEDVARVLLDSPERIELGGEERDVTILLSDLKSYSSISERLSPTQVLELLNAYFGAMNEVFDRHHGIVIEYLGDGILAVFGAPNDLPDNAQYAVRCALAMRERLRELNREWRASGFANLWQEQGVDDLICRIGIHSGPVVAGNLGSEKRMKYAVIGDTVNVAARLEAGNKPLGTSILISRECYVRLPEGLQADAVDHGAKTVKGRTKQVHAYSL